MNFFYPNSVRLGIRTWLLLFVLCSTLPLSGALIFLGWETRRVTAEQAVGSLSSGLEQARLGLEIDLARAAELVAMLSADRRLEAGDREHCATRLAAVRVQMPVVSELLILDRGGRVACSSVSAYGARELADRDFFHGALASPEIVFGRPVLDASSRHASIPIAAARLGPGGEPDGVVVATLDLELFMMRLRERFNQPQAVLTLWNEDGLVLSRSPDQAQLTGKSLSKSELFQALAAAADQPGAAELPSPADDPSIYAYNVVRMAGQRLFVTAGMPAAQLFGAVDEVFHRTVLATALVTAIEIALGLLLWNRAVRWPLRRLVDGVDALAAGDAAPGLLEVKGARELVLLAGHIRRLAGARAERLGSTGHAR